MCTPTSTNFAKKVSELTFPTTAFAFITATVKDDEGNEYLSSWVTTISSLLNDFGDKSIGVIATEVLLANLNGGNAVMAFNTLFNKAYIKDYKTYDLSGINQDVITDYETNLRKGFFPNILNATSFTYENKPSDITITKSPIEAIQANPDLAPYLGGSGYTHVELIDLINDGKDIVIHSCAKAVPSP